VLHGMSSALCLSCRIEIHFFCLNHKLLKVIVVTETMVWMVFVGGFLFRELIKCQSQSAWRNICCQVFDMLALSNLFVSISFLSGMN